ncbi:ribonuclease H2, subunit C [Abortiporus biennis]|nr:ribonuclease H2, subunit C [Abortiporus biennis]
MQPKISISCPPSSSSLPVCSPNLMPFHIAHSGHAPLSTYFRVKTAPAPTFGATSTNAVSKAVKEEGAQNPDSQPSAISSEPTIILEASPTSEESTQVVSSTASTSESTLVSPSETLSTLASTSSEVIGSFREAPVDGTGTHFVAAFRGRTIRGLKVNLPEGYTGLVLRTPEHSSSSSKPISSKPKSNRTESRRSTRRSAQAKQDVDVDEIEEMEMDVAEDEVPVRTLNATSSFNSFALWNPDIPVDVGRDEYLRALKEWTALSNEIHHYEE